MSIQNKGLHGYAYPEVTNILMGQAPFDLFFCTSTATSGEKEHHANTSGVNTQTSVYFPNTKAWCALKVVSWDSTGQLIGGKVQARCVEGFPGADFAEDGTYAGTTHTNMISLVSGDIITGIFDKVSILGAAAGSPTIIMAYRIAI